MYTSRTRLLSAFSLIALVSSGCVMEDGLDTNYGEPAPGEGPVGPGGGGADYGAYTSGFQSVNVSYAAAQGSVHYAIAPEAFNSGQEWVSSYTPGNVIGCAGGVILAGFTIKTALEVGAADVVLVPVALAEPTPLGELGVAVINGAAWTFLAGSAVYAGHQLQNCIPIINTAIVELEPLIDAGRTDLEQRYDELIALGTVMYFAAFHSHLRKVKDSLIQRWQRNCPDDFDAHSIKEELGLGRASRFDIWYDPGTGDLFGARKSGKGFEGEPQDLFLNFDWLMDNC